MVRLAFVSDTHTLHGHVKKIRKVQMGSGRTTWECECPVCGKLFECASSHVARRRSCGCTSADPIARKHKHTAEHASWLQLINQYKMNAKSKGILWCLSDAEAIALFRQCCAYCGTPPDRIKRSCRKHDNIEVLFNGIDRINSRFGYVAGNCATACATCNYAKRVQSVAEFDAWIRRLVKHRFGKDIAEGAS